MTSSCWDSTLPASVKKLSENNNFSGFDFRKGLAHILVLLWICIGISSCESGEKDTEKGDEARLKTMLPDADQRYLHLTGTIGKRAVSMDLVKERGYEGDSFFSGYFYFDDAEEPVPFFSESGDSLKTLILNESGGGEHQNGRFIGEFISGSFHGTFKPQNGKEEPFRLTISREEGSLVLHSISADTFFAASDQGNPPKARFSWHFLRPDEKWLEELLLRDLHGDSLFRIGKGKAEMIFGILGAQYAKDYREDVKPFLGEDEISGVLNYDLSYGMDVAFNRNQLLSVIFTQYQYTGGAHGMMYSRCFSYDVEAGKRLGIGDVFRKGYEKDLKTAINLAARKKYRVKNLSEVLLVDEIEVTNNFFLSGKGICFVYQPYEIGPFSMGEQLIYLPFSSLKDLAK